MIKTNKNRFIMLVCIAFVLLAGIVLSLPCVRSNIASVYAAETGNVTYIYQEYDGTEIGRETGTVTDASVTVNATVPTWTIPSNEYFTYTFKHWKSSDGNTYATENLPSFNHYLAQDITEVTFTAVYDVVYNKELHIDGTIGNTLTPSAIYGGDILIVENGESVDVVTNYAISQNDGIAALLLIPEYDKTLFSIKGIAVNGQLVYGVDATSTEVLSGWTATVTGTEVETDTMKIVLEKLPISTETGDAFIQIIYSMENPVTGEYDFGFVTQYADETVHGSTDVEPSHNDRSEAYGVYSSDPLAKFNELKIVDTDATVKIVVRQNATLTIDPDQALVYDSEAIIAADVTQTDIERFERAIKYAYVGYTITDINGNEIDWDQFITVTWYDEEGNEIAAPTNVGNYQIKVAVAQNEYYNAIDVTEDFAITPYVIDASAVVDNTKTYNGADQTWTLDDLTITDDENKKAFGTETGYTAVLTNATYKDAGTYQATLTLTATDNYTFTTGGTVADAGDKKTITLDVVMNKYDLTITANSDFTSIYGDAITVDQTGYTLSSAETFVTDDIEAGRLTIALTKADGVDAGTYAVTVGTTQNPANYNITTENGTYTITRKAITVPTIDDLTYNGSEQFPSLPADNKDPYDDTKEVYTYTGNSQVDAGDYTLTATLASNNYIWADTTVGATEDVLNRTIDWTINPLAITINVGNFTSVYGEATQEIVGTTTDTVYDELNTIATYVIDGATDANGFYPAGIYDIVPTAADPNYAVAFVKADGNYTVTKKQVTVATADIKGAIKEYTGTELTWEVADFTVLETAVNTNGNLTLDNIVTVASVAAIDGTDYINANGKGADKASWTYYDPTTNKYYEITLSLLDTDNYTLVNTDGKVNGEVYIKQAANEWTVTPTVNADNIEEFATPGDAKFKSDGEVTVVLTDPEGNVVTVNDLVVGTTYTATFTVLETNNWTGLETTVDFSLGFAIVAVPTVRLDTAEGTVVPVNDSITIIYDGLTHKFVVAEDAEKYTITISTADNYASWKNVVADENVYYITLSLTTNYSWSETDRENKTFALVIDKAALTIDADDKTVTYRDAAPAYTATAGGFVNSETYATYDANFDIANYLTAPYIAGTTGAGAYTIGYTDGAEAAIEAILTNYNVTLTTGTLTVNELTLSLDDLKGLLDAAGATAWGEFAPTTPYSGTQHAVSVQDYPTDLTPVITYTDANGNTVQPADVKNAGTYTVTVTFTGDDANLEWTNPAPITLTITKLALTITADDKTVEYRQDPPAYTATATGFLAGEDFDTYSVDETTYLTCGYAKDDKVDTYTITFVADAETTLETLLKNYDVTLADGTLTVTPIAIGLSGLKAGLDNLDNADLWKALAASGGIAIVYDGAQHAIVLDPATYSADLKPTLTYKVNDVATTDVKNVARYIVSVEFNVVDGELASNFTWTNPTETIEIGIKPATVTVSAEAVTKNYLQDYDVNASAEKATLVTDDGYVPTVLVEYKVAGADDATYTTTKPLTVGTYTVRVTANNLTGNYESTPVEKTVVINKATLDGFAITYKKDTATWEAITLTTDGEDINKYGPVEVVYSINDAEVDGTSYTATATGTYTLKAAVKDNENFNEITETLNEVYSVTFNDAVENHAKNDTVVDFSQYNQFRFSGQVATQPVVDSTLTDAVYGYTFQNQWKLDGAAYGFTTQVTKNIDLYAVWTINTYTITWSNDGVTIYTDTYEYLETPVYNSTTYGTPERATTAEWIYTFAGWGTEQVEVGPTITIPAVTEDETYYAVYTRIGVKYTITFMASNDGGEYYQYAQFIDAKFDDVIADYCSMDNVLWFRTDSWYTDEARTIKATTVPVGGITVYGGYVFDIGNGDVNANGSITTDDIMLYRQWIVGGYEMTVVEEGTEWTLVNTAGFADTLATTRYFVKRVADVNKDTSNDIRDITTIRMALVGGYGYNISTGVNKLAGVTGEAVVVGVDNNVWYAPYIPGFGTDITGNEDEYINKFNAIDAALGGAEGASQTAALFGRFNIQQLSSNLINPNGFVAGIMDEPDFTAVYFNQEKNVITFSLEEAEQVVFAWFEDDTLLAMRQYQYSAEEGDNVYLSAPVVTVHNMLGDGMITLGAEETPAFIGTWAAMGEATAPEDVSGPNLTFGKQPVEGLTGRLVFENDGTATFGEGTQTYTSSWTREGNVVSVEFYISPDAEFHSMGFDLYLSVAAWNQAGRPEGGEYADDPDAFKTILIIDDQGDMIMFNEGVLVNGVLTYWSKVEEGGDGYQEGVRYDEGSEEFNNLIAEMDALWTTEFGSDLGHTYCYKHTDIEGNWPNFDGDYATEVQTYNEFMSGEHEAPLNNKPTDLLKMFKDMSVSDIYSIKDEEKYVLSGVYTEDGSEYVISFWLYFDENGGFERFLMAQTSTDGETGTYWYVELYNGSAGGETPEDQPAYIGAFVGQGIIKRDTNNGPYTKITAAEVLANEGSYTGDDISAANNISKYSITLNLDNTFTFTHSFFGTDVSLAGTWTVSNDNTKILELTIIANDFPGLTGFIFYTTRAVWEEADFPSNTDANSSLILDEGGDLAMFVSSRDGIYMSKTAGQGGEETTTDFIGTFAGAGLALLGSGKIYNHILAEDVLANEGSYRNTDYCDAPDLARQVNDYLLIINADNTFAFTIGVDGSVITFTGTWAVSVDNEDVIQLTRTGGDDIGISEFGFFTTKAAWEASDVNINNGMVSRSVLILEENGDITLLNVYEYVGVYMSKTAGGETPEEPGETEIPEGAALEGSEEFNNLIAEMDALWTTEFGSYLGHTYSVKDSSGKGPLFVGDHGINIYTYQQVLEGAGDIADYGINLKPSEALAWNKSELGEISNVFIYKAEDRYVISFDMAGAGLQLRICLYFNENNGFDKYLFVVNDIGGEEFEQGRDYLYIEPFVYYADGTTEFTTLLNEMEALYQAEFAVDTGKMYLLVSGVNEWGNPSGARNPETAVQGHAKVTRELKSPMTFYQDDDWMPEGTEVKIYKTSTEYVLCFVMSYEGQTQAYKLVLKFNDANELEAYGMVMAHDLTYENGCEFFFVKMYDQYGIEGTDKFNEYLADMNRIYNEAVYEGGKYEVYDNSTGTFGLKTYDEIRAEINFNSPSEILNYYKENGTVTNVVAYVSEHSGERYGKQASYVKVLKFHLSADLEYEVEIRIYVDGNDNLIDYQVVLDNPEGQSKNYGFTIPSEAELNTSITFETGYVSDSDGPTTTPTMTAAEINFDGGYYVLPYEKPGERYGYIFRGWTCPDYNKGELQGTGAQINELGNHVWTAQWINLSEKIKLYTGYTGDENSPTNQETVAPRIEGSYYYLPANLQANDGWAFLGWKQTTGKQEKYLEVAGGKEHGVGFDINNWDKLEVVTYTAVWIHESQIVIHTGYTTENSPTSTETASVSIEFDGTNYYYNLPEAPVANEGYLFNGWGFGYVGSSNVEDVYSMQTLEYNHKDGVNWYADWIQIDSIQFYVNTGYVSDTEGPTTTQTAEIAYYANEGVFYLPEAPVAREGYVFAGWRNNNDGMRYANAGESLKNFRLTSWQAMWVNTNNITIDTGYVGEGEGPTTQQTATVRVEQNGRFYLPYAPVANDGYIFLGWQRDSDGAICEENSEMSPEDSNSEITFTAQWFDKSTVTINTGYVAEGESPTPAATFEPNIYHGGSEFIFELQGSPAANKGYNFIGWKDENGKTYDSVYMTLTEAQGKTFTAVWAKYLKKVPVEIIFIDESTGKQLTDINFTLNKEAYVGSTSTTFYPGQTNYLNIDIPGYYLPYFSTYSHVSYYIAENGEWKTEENGISAQVPKSSWSGNSSNSRIDINLDLYENCSYQMRFEFRVRSTGSSGGEEPEAVPSVADGWVLTQEDGNWWITGVPTVEQNNGSTKLRIPSQVINENSETVSVYGIKSSDEEYMNPATNANMYSSIEIEDGIQEIGNFAFAGCFNSTSIELPSTLKTIGNYSFALGTSLTSIVIPSSVNSIGANPFACCISLESITVAEGNAAYCDDNGRALLTSDVVTLIAYANMSGTEYTIPSSVTNIGEAAFVYCTNIAEITVNAMITELGDKAVDNLAVKTLIIGKDIPYFPTNVLPTLTTIIVEEGSSMASSPLPAGIWYKDGVEVSQITGAGTYVALVIADTVYTTESGWQYEFDGTNFWIIGVPELDEATNPEKAITIPSTLQIAENKTVSIYGARGGYDWETRLSWAMTNIASYTSVTIDNGITSIGYYTFENCSNLAEVTINGNIATIGEDVFAGCTNLRELVINGDITTIEPGAFSYYECDALTTLTIGANVTSLPADLFTTHLTNLTTINVDQANTVYEVVPSTTTEGKFALVQKADGTVLKDDLLGNIIIPSVADGWVLTQEGENWWITGVPTVEQNNGSTILRIPSQVINENGETVSVYGIKSTLALTQQLPMPNATAYTNVTISNGIKEIGEGAFVKCESLASVSIPNSVTTIGEGAFVDCTNATITFAEGCVISELGQYAFHGCTGTISGIVLADGITEIPHSAFYNCDGLTSIEIPSSVTRIGESAFASCQGLTSIEIPSRVTTIGESAFRDCTFVTITFAPGCIISSLGASSFEDCTRLKSITLGEGITEIPNSAFANCRGLTSIEIPSSVTTIGASVFRGCTGLTSIEIPNSVTTIGAVAFNGYKGEIIFAEGTVISSLGASSFEDCTRLKSITLGEGITEIPNSAFANCTGLTSIEIPSSVTTIGGRAFYGCTGLTSIEIPASVTTIGDYAFNGYKGEIIFAEGTVISSLGNRAFYGCTGTISGLVLGGELTQISSQAFEGCTDLTSITIKGNITTLGVNAFTGCDKLTTLNIGSEVTSLPAYLFAYYLIYLTTINVDPANTVYEVVASTTTEGKFALVQKADGTVLKDGLDGNLTKTPDETEEGTEGLVYTGLDANGNATTDESQIVAYMIGDGTSVDSNGYTGTATDIVIPNFYKGKSVTTIGQYAFGGCSSITSIEIPNSVTTIGESAFTYCTNLRELVINGDITTIGYGGFGGCDALTTLTIGADVTSLPADLFTTHLTNLTTIIVNTDALDEKGIALPAAGDGYVWYRDDNEGVTTIEIGGIYTKVAV